MNDEIKEILIFIENKIYPKDSLLFEKWSFLKDYITNLEQENEDDKSRMEKAVECIKDIFKDEKWYENYEYNDLENALKNVLNILQNGSDASVKD